MAPLRYQHHQRGFRAVQAWQSSSSKQKNGQPSAPALLGDAETDDAKATTPARAIAEEKRIEDAVLYNVLFFVVTVVVRFGKNLFIRVDPPESRCE
ncbi:hypothetical protein EV702DRAFT_1277252 [Suillus placidus]|uniref:Uncharacterized protein n=1 Tax=Suillus placidus TaxID=48579 RepID=A0A9P7D4X4_9AGAM|nr:hypothetical protein EV702DRAFT_1277252 [Suillus placidus]